MISNSHTNLKKAGQGVIIVLAFFIFTAPAFAVGTYTPTQYVSGSDTVCLSMTEEEFNAPPISTLSNKKFFIQQHGSGAENTNLSAFSDYLNNYAAIPSCVAMSQSQLDSFGVIDQDLVDVVVYSFADDNFHLVGTLTYCPADDCDVPETPATTCSSGSATGSLCMIGSAIVSGSVGVAENVVSNYFGFTIIVTLLILFVAYFGGGYWIAFTKR